MKNFIYLYIIKAIKSDSKGNQLRTTVMQFTQTAGKYYFSIGLQSLRLGTVYDLTIYTAI